MYNFIRPPPCGGQWIAGTIVAFGGFISGLCIVWAAIAFPKMDEIDLKLNYLEESAVATCLHVGQVVGTIISAPLQDRIGRLNTLIIIINFPLVSWLMLYFLHKLWAILIARVMMGIWMAVAITSCTPYLSEIAAHSIRGRISLLLAFMLLCGCVFQSTVGSFISYNALALASFGFTFILLLSLVNIPESVYSMLQLGKVEKAEQNLKWFRGKDDVSIELAKIKHDLTKQMSRKHGYLDVFRFPPSRKAFLQSVSLILIQRFGGIHALASFTSIILPDSWIESTKYPIVWNSINLVCLSLGFFYIDNIDRKTLLLISCIGTAIFGALLSIWFFLHEKTNYDMSKTLWLPLLCLSIHALFFSTGLLFIPILFQGEIFSMNIKSKANCMIAFVGFMTSILVVQIFLPLKVHVGMFANFLLYTISSIVGCYLSMKIVETRGKTLETIQKILEGRLEEESSESQASP